jgi:hypothetical protein
MAAVTDVSIAATTTSILTVDNPTPKILWNPGPVPVAVHFAGPAGVANDYTIPVDRGITAPGNQRVDGIDATATGVIQVLSGVEPGG